MASELPPIAAERVRRQAESRVAGSLLSAPAAAALAAAGLEPAGEVMGCVAVHLGWTGQAGCGFYNRYNSTTPVRIGGHYSAYMKALNGTYAQVIGRMTAESEALGADGVVGVRLEWSRLDQGARELLALGTAVRYRRSAPSAGEQQRPHFSTELGADQVATAILAGWHPVRLLVAASIAVKHEDTTTKQFTSRLRTPQNVELGGLTNLVQAARTDARARLAKQADGLTGQIVISSNTLELHERQCGTEKDHVAECTLIGTLLELDPNSTGRVDAPSVLSIMPIRP